MKTRTTKADIMTELTKLARVAERLGLKDRSEKWVLIRGSVQNGEPWRLGAGDRRNVVWVEFLPQGNIGANTTEVMNNVKVLRMAWEHVYRKQKEV